MLRRTFALLAAASALGLSTAPAASAAEPVSIPLPPIQVQEICGSRNDALTVDPAWMAAWGDKTVIYPESLTFQGGSDGDYAKPAGQILAPYRTGYVWAGSGTGWDSWSLYPGTVKPILDANTPCLVPVAVPAFTQTERRGPHNDIIAFTNPADADRWTIVSQSWTGQTLTVTLQAKQGYTAPDGQTVVNLTFTDRVNRGVR